jgi:hypothetical protein
MDYTIIDPVLMRQRVLKRLASWRFEIAEQNRANVFSDLSDRPSKMVQWPE